MSKRRLGWKSSQPVWSMAHIVSWMEMWHHINYIDPESIPRTETFYNDWILYYFILYENIYRYVLIKHNHLQTNLVYCVSLHCILKILWVLQIEGLYQVEQVCQCHSSTAFGTSNLSYLLMFAIFQILS